MSGARNGVAAKITAIEPRAVYIHCAGHTLNLALQDSAQLVTIIRDTLDLTRELINFIKYSPKRSHIFEEIRNIIPLNDQITVELSLRPLCPTLDCQDRIIDVSVW